MSQQFPKFSVSVLPVGILRLVYFYIHPCLNLCFTWRIFTDHEHLVHHDSPPISSSYSDQVSERISIFKRMNPRDNYVITSDLGIIYHLSSDNPLAIKKK